METIKMGDVVRFTDKTCKKFKSKKWQKEHERFWNILQNILPINAFEVQGFDCLFGKEKIDVAGFFEWYIDPKEIELVSEEELKNPNFFWIKGNYAKYDNARLEFRRQLGLV